MKTRIARDRRQPVDLGRALVEAFLTNERINHNLLDLLDPAIWRQFPPSSPRRNIATSFAHVHNVRCMRLRMSGAKAPKRLERGTVTMDQAREALAESARAVVALVEASLEAGGHVKDFRPDVVGLVCAAITHRGPSRPRSATSRASWARRSAPSSNCGFGCGRSGGRKRSGGTSPDHSRGHARLPANDPLRSHRRAVDGSGERRTGWRNAWSLAVAR